MRTNKTYSSMNMMMCSYTMQMQMHMKMVLFSAHYVT